MPKTYFPDFPKLPDPSTPIENIAKGIEMLRGNIVGFEEARRKLFRTVDDSIKDIQRAVRQRR